MWGKGAAHFGNAIWHFAIWHFVRPIGHMAVCMAAAASTGSSGIACGEPQAAVYHSVGDGSCVPLPAAPSPTLWYTAAELSLEVHA